MMVCRDISAVRGNSDTDSFRLAGRHISLRGVRVHNLDAIDLDIPHGKLIVLCGLSGSGKSSLAMDTLYAEGQRRYIESFSAYTRQFLERLEKPDADRIDGIPPAIAVTGKNATRSSRATVGTATETADYLRLLFAKVGHVFCSSCGREVRRDSPQTAAEVLAGAAEGTRYMIAFSVAMPDADQRDALTASLREDGLLRVVVAGRTVDLSAEPLPDAPESSTDVPLLVVVDRLASGSVSDQRVRDSLETAFAKGKGRCCALLDEGDVAQPPSANVAQPPSANVAQPPSAVEDVAQASTAEGGCATCVIDGRPWRRIAFSTRLACEDCGLEYPEQEPRLFSFNSPLGACPECEGFGNVIDLDMELVVPDPGKRRRPVEQPGLSPRTRRVDRPGRRLRRPARRPVRPARRAASGADHQRRRRAGFWRVARVLCVARAAKIQDAHSGVPEPVAELSDLPGL
jgi:excinuclease ABC subunit A